MITDRFDRAELGPNYASPGRYGELAGWGGSTVADNCIISSPRIVTQDPNWDTPIGDAVYTALGEFATDQFSEITIADDFEQRAADYVSYYKEYAYYGCLLNVPPLADTSQAWVALRIWTGYYGPNNPYYGSVYPPFYADIVNVNPAGSIIDTSAAPYYSSFADMGFIDGEEHMPVGTKFRLESVGGVYYGYVFNPTRGVWTQMLTMTDTIGAADGYPGFILGTYGPGVGDDELLSCSISEFRAGQIVDNDTFLTSNSLTADDSMVRSLVRNFWPPDDSGGDRGSLENPVLPSIGDLSLGASETLPAQSTVPRGALWNSDGTQLTVQQSNWTYAVYAATTPYDASSGNLTHTNTEQIGDISISVMGRLAPDGSSLYVSDQNAFRLCEYVLSTPDDVTSLTPNQTRETAFLNTLNTSAWDFAKEGEWAFIWDDGSNTLASYALSPAFALSGYTATEDVALDGFGTNNLGSLIVSADGLTIWGLVEGGTDIWEWTLASAYTLAGNSHTGTFALTPGSNSDPLGLFSPKNRNEIWLTWRTTGQVIQSYVW